MFNDGTSSSFQQRAHPSQKILRKAKFPSVKRKALGGMNKVG